MQTRDAIPRVIGTVEGALPTLGLKNFYSGAWTDQKAGGILHLQFASGSTEQSIAHLIASLIPATIRYSIDKVPFTAAELDEAHDKITTGITHGANWLKWFERDEIDEIGNTVRIYMDPTTPARIRAEVTQLFPVEAPVTASYSSNTAAPDTRDHLSGKLYGGEWINNGSTGNCTNGYGHSRGGAGDTDHYYSITAGHCGNGNFYQGIAGKGGNYFGSGYNNGFLHTSSQCDCVAVGPLPASAVTNEVYTSNTSLQAYGNTATQSSYHPGNKVCMSGAFYADHHAGAIKCSTIQASTTDAKYQDASDIKGSDFTLLDGAVTNITDAMPGDSGGPEGNGLTFLGFTWQP